MEIKANVEILEKEASVICGDFVEFCDYLVEKKVKLSKQTGYIGKKDCFEINSMFHVKENYEKPTRFQSRYPIINFFYYVAVRYKILEINSSGNKMVYGRNYQLYRDSTVFEQYVLLLLTFVFDGKFSSDDYHFRWAVEHLFVWEEKEKPCAGDVCQLPSIFLNPYLPNEPNGIIPYMEELRLLKVLKIKIQEENTYNLTSEIEILPLFRKVVDSYEAVYDKAEYVWDKEKLISQYFKEYVEYISQETGETHLQKIFGKDDKKKENGIIDLEVKVRWGDCIRVLRLNLSDTLYDVHMAIQNAFEFDNDHLFAFYIGHGMMKMT